MLRWDCTRSKSSSQIASTSWGRLVAHAANVRQALDWLFRLHKLMGSKPRFQLLETAGHATLRYETPSGLSERARRSLAEFHTAGKHRLLRRSDPKGA
jgi:Arabinose-binding domain of AraC transcription regulator, N-term